MHKQNSYLSILTIHVISSSSCSLLSAMNFIEVKRNFASKSQQNAAVLTAFSNRTMRSTSRMLRRLTAVSPRGREKKDPGNEVEFTSDNGGSFPKDYSWIANANATSRRKTRHKSASTN